MDVEKYSVIINGTDISKLTGVDLYNHNFHELPEREIKIYKLARESLSVVTSAEYTKKEITVFMDVCGGSRSDTEELITKIKAISSVYNSELKVKIGGIWYRYIATLNEFSTKFNGIGAELALSFIASTPVGTSIDDFTMFSISGITSTYATNTFMVDGSMEAQPTITVTMTSVSGSGSFTIVNGRNGQGITINTPVVSGDIIEINSAEKIVTKNGSPIDFIGVFPVFGAGEQQVQYSDTFTTRQVTVTGTYHKRII